MYSIGLAVVWRRRERGPADIDTHPPPPSPGDPSSRDFRNTKRFHHDYRSRSSARLGTPRPPDIRACRFLKNLRCHRSFESKRYHPQLKVICQQQTRRQQWLSPIPRRLRAKRKGVCRVQALPQFVRLFPVILVSLLPPLSRRLHPPPSSWRTSSRRSKLTGGPLVCAAPVRADPRSS